MRSPSGRYVAREETSFSSLPRPEQIVTKQRAANGILRWKKAGPWSGFREDRMDKGTFWIVARNPKNSKKLSFSKLHICLFLANSGTDVSDLGEGLTARDTFNNNPEYKSDGNSGLSGPPACMAVFPGKNRLTREGRSWQKDVCAGNCKTLAIVAGGKHEYRQRSPQAIHNILERCYGLVLIFGKHGVR